MQCQTNTTPDVYSVQTACFGFTKMLGSCRVEPIKDPTLTLDAKKMPMVH